MPTLTVMTGDQAGTRFELASRPLSVGRDPSRDIQIVDPKVSRKHAVVVPEAGDYLVRPAKSLNGLFVNGVAVEVEMKLADGDRISLGETELIYNEIADGRVTNAVNVRKDASRQNRDQNTIM